MSVIQNADKTLKNIAYEKAHREYGHNLPVIVQDRLETELKIIIQHDYSEMFMISQEIAQQLRDDDYPFCYSGVIGSSLVAYLAGITNVNPLPPHWHCQKCCHSEFFTDGTYASGFDLPDNDCPDCGEPMTKDGHDIPYAVLFGIDGSRKPYIAITIPMHEQPFVKRFIEQLLLGKDNVSITETVELPPYETMKPYVQVHLGEHTLYILKYNELDLLKKLEDNTHCSLLDISFDDFHTLSSIRFAEPPGFEEWRYETSMRGIKGFSDPDVCQILSEIKPNCFSELVKISSLSHGSGTWWGNAEALIRDGVCTISNVVANRDDVMLYLIRKGIKPSDAFRIMETVRKGKKVDRDTEEMLKAHDIPGWYIASCRKIQYLVPRAHDVSCVMAAYQLAYYKAHYPEDFYRAYIEVFADKSDIEVIKDGKNKVNEELDKIMDAKYLGKGMEEWEEKLNLFKIAHEMYLRGYTL